MGVEAGSAEACRWKTLRFVLNFYMQDWLLVSLSEYNMFLDGVKLKSTEEFKSSRPVLKQ